MHHQVREFRVVPQFICCGKVTRPLLGVQLAPQQLARRLGLKGVLVLDVQPDGPAAKAGLRPTRPDPNKGARLGDVIVALDGKPVRSADDLLDLLERHRPGDTVQVTVLRDGQEQKVPVALEEGGTA
jgi:S1-C subfamily serine protease